jgi:hypothetical protein
MEWVQARLQEDSTMLDSAFDGSHEKKKSFMQILYTYTYRT